MSDGFSLIDELSAQWSIDMTDTQDVTTDSTTCPAQASSSRPATTRPSPDELTEFDLPVDGAIPPETRRLVPAQRTQPARGHRALVQRRRHDPRRPHRGRRRPSGTATAGCAPTASTSRSRSTTPTAPATCASAVANTHVVNHAGKTLALVESSLPYEITNDLETVGAYDFGGKLVDSMTAHPKICPTTGRDALLRLRQHLRAARHLSPRRRQRRADHQPSGRRQGADDDARLRDDRERT